MPWVPLAAAAIGAISAGKTRRSMARQARLDRAERAKAKKELDVRIKKYEDSEYIPLDLEAYKQENVYEDLTVDTEAADYAMQQFQQSQANIMQGLQGVAGASGAAGLAQSLSLRAADQSRQTQLTLGQQLQQNRKLAMGEEARLNDQQRQLRLADAEGRRQFDMDKMTTLIGVAGGKTAAANQNFAQSQSNVLNLQGQQTQMWSSAVGATDWKALGTSFGFNSASGTPTTPVWMGPSGLPGSDRRLKKNINLIGCSPSGLNIYSFEYKDSKLGEGLFQGVMSDEISSEAVVNVDGYDTVNYSMLDVEFKQI